MTLTREDKNQGFTLIELMIVFAIISFLAAMAITTFLGSRQTAALRNENRELAMTLQVARMRAISTGLAHGVAFERRDGDTPATKGPDCYAIFMDCTSDGHYTDNDSTLANNWEGNVVSNTSQCPGSPPKTVDPMIQGQAIKCLSPRNYFARILGTTKLGEGSSADGALEYILFTPMGQATQGGALVSGEIFIQDHVNSGGKVESAGVRVIGGAGMAETLPLRFVDPEAWK